MEFWSKGLGRRSLGIDCGTETVAVEDGMVFLRGTVKPPLSWGYTISMDEADWAAFFELAVHPVVVAYLLRPRRWGLAAKAAWHLAAFFIAYLGLLVWRRGRVPKERPALELPSASAAGGEASRSTWRAASTEADAGMRMPDAPLPGDGA